MYKPHFVVSRGVPETRVRSCADTHDQFSFPILYLPNKIVVFKCGRGLRNLDIEIVYIVKCGHNSDGPCFRCTSGRRATGSHVKSSHVGLPLKDTNKN